MGATSCRSHRATSDLERELLTGIWRFQHIDGAVETENLVFQADGTIQGDSHQNEAGWTVADGCLNVLDTTSHVTSRLSMVTGDDGKVSLRGPSLRAPHVTLLVVRASSWQAPHLSWSTKLLLVDKVQEMDWSFGDHAYGLPEVFEERTAQLSIGKFTSIADGVVITLGNHATGTISTYPFATLRANWLAAPASASDHVSHGDVSIGNDV